MKNKHTAYLVVRIGGGYKNPTISQLSNLDITGCLWESFYDWSLYTDEYTTYGVYAQRSDAQRHKKLDDMITSLLCEETGKSSIITITYNGTDVHLKKILSKYLTNEDRKLKKDITMDDMLVAPTLHAVVVDDSAVIDEIEKLVGLEISEVGCEFDACPGAVELDFDCDTQEEYDTAFSKLKQANHPLVVHFGKNSVEELPGDKLKLLEKAWERLLVRNPQFL